MQLEGGGDGGKLSGFRLKKPTVYPSTNLYEIVCMLLFQDSNYRYMGNMYYRGVQWQGVLAPITGHVMCTECLLGGAIEYIPRRISCGPWKPVCLCAGVHASSWTNLQSTSSNLSHSPGSQVAHGGGRVTTLTPTQLPPLPTVAGDTVLLGLYSLHRTNAAQWSHNVTNYLEAMRLFIVVVE